MKTNNNNSILNNRMKPSYVLIKNQYGNYEHPETHLVFDRILKCVYGKQVENNVVNLTIEDKELCRRLNFKVFTKII